MARHRYDVFGAEYLGLFQDAAADLGEREAVCSGMEAVEPAGRLHRLKDDAADRRLRDGVLDDAAELAVVEASLDRDHERGGNPELIEPLDGRFPGAPQID